MTGPTREEETGADADSPRRPRAGVTLLITLGMASLVALTISSGYAGRSPEGWFFALDLAVGVVGCCLVPVVLRWPVPGALALAVLAALSPAATPPATMGTLHVAQRRRFAMAVGVAVAGALAHAVQGLWRPFSGMPYAWWLVLIIAAQAALTGWGAWGQARRALVCSLRERARRAEEEQGRRIAEARVLERTRIAREMHDVLAHRLTLLATYAGAMEYRPDSSPEQLSNAAGVIRSGVHQALTELREVIGVLRADPHDPHEPHEPHVPHDPTGEASTDPCADPELTRPQPVLADLPRLVEESRDAGTRVRLDNRVTAAEEPPGAAGRTAYRIVQEGLTNARKHAGGQPVDVVVCGKPGKRLVVEVRNPLPAGPATQPAPPGAGTGLIGPAERVELAGGVLDHEITAGREFRLSASLPWPA